MYKWLVPPQTSTSAAHPKSWKKRAAPWLVLAKWKPNGKSLPFALWSAPTDRDGQADGERWWSKSSLGKSSVWGRSEVKSERIFFFHGLSTRKLQLVKILIFSALWKRRIKILGDKIIVILLHSINQFEANGEKAKFL